MSDNINTIIENAKVEINGCKNANLLKTIEQKYIGNNGLLVRSARSALDLPPSFKDVRLRAIDNAINKVKRMISKKTKEDFNGRL